MPATQKRRNRKTAEPAGDVGFRLLNQEEAAAVLRLAPATLAAWRSREKGPTVTRIGRRCLYQLDDLIAFAREGAK
jgi:hypothetical protein